MKKLFLFSLLFSLPAFAMKRTNRDTTLNPQKKQKIDKYALIESVKNGNYPTAQLLIKNREIDLNARGFAGETALHHAANNGHIDMVRILIEAGIRLNIQNNHGDTAPHYASYQGHREVVEILIKAGAQVNLQAKDKETALFMAMYEGHTKIAKLLVTAGADLNIQNKYGNTALHKATQNSYPESVEILIKAAANVLLLNNVKKKASELDPEATIKTML